MMKEKIYLDNSTSCRPSKAQVFLANSFFEEMYGSHEAMHAMGSELYPAKEKAIRQIFSLFGAKDDDLFVLTSSGEEAISQVVLSIVKSCVRQQGKNQCIVIQEDESSIMPALKAYEDEGLKITVCHLENGKLTKEMLIGAISPRCALLSISLGSGLTGHVLEVEEIVEICRKRGILVHFDVSAVVGKKDLDLDLLGADYLTFNGEQIGAMKGTGGLFVRVKEKKPPLFPLIHGDNQNNFFRGGQLNMLALCTLGQLALEAKADINVYCTEVLRLRNRFEECLQEAYPEVEILFQDDDRLPHIAVCVFPGIKNDALLFQLSRKGVFATIGQEGGMSLEKMLRARNIASEKAMCAVSFSLSKETSDAQIEKACQIIQECAKKLRRLTLSIIEPQNMSNR